jgi:hypothetical protein
MSTTALPHSQPYQRASGRVYLLPCYHMTLLHSVLPPYIATLRHCYMAVKVSDSFLEAR